MALKITTAANDRPVLWLYGEVGVDFTASDVRDALNTIPKTKDVDVRVHSEGGSYLESIAIHSNFVNRDGDAYMHVDGLAASGGSVIVMAGKSVQMADGSWMMLHEARGSAREYTAHELRDAASRLDTINDELVKIYSKRWKGESQSLRDALAAETWLAASDAVKIGLADGVGKALAVAAKADWDKFAYCHVPEELLAPEEKFPRLAEAGSVVDMLFADQSESA